MFQPHRYSRLRDLFEDFCLCFNEADIVIIADVYAAGEQAIEGVGRDSLTKGIHDHGHRDSRALPSKESLPELLAGIAKPGDYILCMGAGDITAWANALPAQLAAEIEKKRGRAA